MYNIDDWDYRKKLLIDSIGDDLLNHDKNGSINQKKQYTESILENCYNYYGCDDKTIELNGDDTPVLVGYKGNDIDSGLFYCPQLPFYVENNMVKSKYAFTELGGELPENYELNCKAKDYYGKIDIETSTLRFF